MLTCWRMPSKTRLVITPPGRNGFPLPAATSSKRSRPKPASGGWRRCSPASLADLDDLLEPRDGQNEDLAVAHSPRAGDLVDPLDNFAHPGVVNPDFDLDLRQESEGIFRMAVLFQVAFLPTVAFHLADGQRFERGAAEPLDDFLG